MTDVLILFNENKNITMKNDEKVAVWNWFKGYYRVVDVQVGSKFSKMQKKLKKRNADTQKNKQMLTRWMLNQRMGRA